MVTLKKKRSISFFLFLLLMWSLVVPAAFAEGTGGGAGAGTTVPASIVIKVLKNGQEVNQQNPLQANDPFSLVVVGSNISRLYGYSIDFKYDPQLMQPALEPFNRTTNGDGKTIDGTQVFSSKPGNYGTPLLSLDHYPNRYLNTVTIVEHLVESDNDPTTTVGGVVVPPNTVLGTMNFVANATVTNGEFIIKTGDSLAQLGLNGVNLTVALADDTPEVADNPATPDVNEKTTTQPIPYQIPTPVSVVFGEYVPAVVITSPAPPVNHEPVTVRESVYVAGTTRADVTDIEISVAPKATFPADMGTKVSGKIPVADGEFSETITMPAAYENGLYYLVVEAFKGTEQVGGEAIEVNYEKTEAQDSVTVDDVSTKKQGHQVTITGTTSLAQVNVKVFGPGQTTTPLFSVDVTPTAAGVYTHNYTLGSEAPLGTYTIVVGNGTVQASDTFEVISGTTSPGSATISLLADKNSIAIDQEVILKLNLTNLANGLSGTGVTVSFDKSKLQFIGLDTPSNGYLSGVVTSDVETSNADGEVILQYASAGVEITQAQLAGLRFKALDVGISNLNISVETLSDQDSIQYYPIIINNLNLNLIRGYYYDVDGNASVTADDAVYILKYKAKREKTPPLANTVTLQQKLEQQLTGYWYDVNNDGSITADDAVYILKFKAKREKTPNVPH